ncbi:hypothetical protein [Paenibacillus mucilaginosus]|uniref:hypothetical protein n=1 Tax=Paenibacillus mucilaginosus TaxID=61624 RepID=UPI00240E2071|nr:hypothetical protein [Paenibacillus mucilaginosus]
MVTQELELGIRIIPDASHLTEGEEPGTARVLFLAQGEGESLAAAAEGLPAALQREVRSLARAACSRAAWVRRRPCRPWA